MEDVKVKVEPLSPSAAPPPPAAAVANPEPPRNVQVKTEPSSPPGSSINLREGPSTSAAAAAASGGPVETPIFKVLRSRKVPLQPPRKKKSKQPDDDVIFVSDSTISTEVIDLTFSDDE